MELKHIKETKCPICGTDIIVSESVETEPSNCMEIRTHVNGEHWEHRTFACGQRISYSPNFRSVQLSKYSVCTNNKAYKDEIKQEKEAREKVEQCIKELNVDDVYKKKLFTSVHYV